jgi:hypothetical protein
VLAGLASLRVTRPVSRAEAPGSAAGLSESVAAGSRVADPSPAR